MKSIKFANTLFLFLLILQVSCTKQNNSTVIISSTPTNNSIIEIFSKRLSGNNTPENLEVVVAGNSTLRFTADSVEVRTFEIIYNENESYSQIFVTPGDSVSFDILVLDKENNQLQAVFSGNNAAHYNYYTMKEQLFPDEKKLVQDAKIDFNTFKRNLEIYRDKQLQFLSEYKKKHKVSTVFYNYAVAEIHNHHAYKLLFQGYYIKNTLTDKDVSDVVIMQHPLSLVAMPALELKYIDCSLNDDLEAICKRIQEEVDPIFQEKLLEYFIAYFAEKVDENNKQSFLSIKQKIEKTKSASTPHAVIQESKKYSSLKKTILPDNILDQTYLRSFESDEAITLRQVFEKNKGKSMFIGFWASWCFPCRKTIRDSDFTKNYFSENDITQIYISIDENEQDWINASIEDNNTKNQYLLVEGADVLRNYLKMYGVPRYILFNKYYQIELFIAPWPSKRQFEELKEKISLSLQ